MPAALRAQLRCPAARFGLQAQVLARYHVDPAAAFGRADAWTPAVAAAPGRTPTAVCTRAGGSELAA